MPPSCDCKETPWVGLAPTPTVLQVGSLVGTGEDHRQDAGVVTILTAHLSFHRDTRGPRNAQTVADFRSGQVWCGGGAGLQKRLSTLSPCPPACALGVS